MKNTTINTKGKVRTGLERTREDGQSKVELSTGSLIAAGAFTAVIGIWVAACFIGGLAVSGGPVTLVKSWFTAVTGM